MDERTWQEFNDAGMLWLVNTQLMTFGFMLMTDIGNDGIERVYPARITAWRGYTAEANAEGVQQVSLWMLQNAPDLYNEATPGV